MVVSCTNSVKRIENDEDDDNDDNNHNVDCNSEKSKSKRFEAQDSEV